MLRFRPGMVFAVVCIGFVLGVGAGSFALPWWVVGVAFFVCGLWGILSKKIVCRWHDVVLFTFVFCCGAFLGAWRYTVVQPSTQSVMFVADSEMHDVEGVVVRREEGDTHVRLTLADVVVDDRAHEDRVLVKASLFADVRVGERMSVLCRLKRPEAFEDFAYDRYLAAKDIVATCEVSGLPFILGKSDALGDRVLSVIEVIQQFILVAIDAILPDPHAQLLAGLLIGDNAFSTTWKERFLRTGTSHIVAASGSNVALTVSILLGVFFGVGVRRKYATMFVLLGIVLFVLVAGGERAVVRAGIMASLVVIARATGRASSVRNVLLCTVCVMLYGEPRILRDDIGFQLSVLSTVGLIFWSKSFAKHLSFLPEKFGIREGFATTLAATVATLPVTAFGMGQVSLVGPLANLLVLPLLPLAMLFGAIATIIGMVWVPVGRLFALPTWWMLDVVLMMLRELAALPFVYLEVKNWMLDVAMGCGGIVVGVVRRMLQAFPARESTHVRGERFVPLALFCGLFILSLFQHVTRDGWFLSQVQVWVFDVGQGDGIFIDTPEKDVVIDGWPSFAMREKLGEVLPWFDRRIDYVFLTHPHADHLVGLVSVFVQYDVDFFGVSGQGCASVECRALAAVAPEPFDVQAGSVFMLAPGVTLQAVWPNHPYEDEKLSDPNDGSLVFLLETPNGSMLFTGDAGSEQEEEFVSLLPNQVEVLKVGHHGSRTSTSETLLSAIQPSIGIISLGTDNSFGHPHEETIEQLWEYGVETYRTDALGNIRVEFGENGPFISGFSL